MPRARSSSGSRSRRSTPRRVEAVLARFRGIQQQVPPMYSALKRDGRPLYELARQGVEVERAARTIEIRRLELVALRDAAIDLVCECAKGTYIRVLGEDIARALGTCGHLTRLHRAWVEPFQRPADGDAWRRYWPGADERRRPCCRPDAALQGLPQASLTDEQVSARAPRPGGARRCRPDAQPGRRVRLYGADGRFPGPRRGAAGRLVAAASPDPGGRHVSLCFEKPFL